MTACTVQGMARVRHECTALCQGYASGSVAGEQSSRFQERLFPGPGDRLGTRGDAQLPVQEYTCVLMVFGDRDIAAAICGNVRCVASKGSRRPSAPVRVDVPEALGPRSFSGRAYSSWASATRLLRSGRVRSSSSISRISVLAPLRSLRAR